MADGKKVVTKKTQARAPALDQPVPASTGAAALPLVTKKTVAKQTAVAKQTVTSSPPPGAVTPAPARAPDKPASKPAAKPKTAALAPDPKPAPPFAASRKKTPAKKTAVKPAPAAQPSARSGAAPLEKRSVKLPARLEVTPEQRHRMVEEAAYYRAQRLGAGAGSPEHNWYEAEREIDKLLGGGG